MLFKLRLRDYGARRAIWPGGVARGSDRLMDLEPVGVRCVDETIQMMEIWHWQFSPVGAYIGLRKLYYLFVSYF